MKYQIYQLRLLQTSSSAKLSAAVKGDRTTFYDKIIFKRSGTIGQLYREYRKEYLGLKRKGLNMFAKGQKRQILIVNMTGSRRQTLGMSLIFYIALIETRKIPLEKDGARPWAWILD
jgi:Na+-transporting NADH:ubiquinone oxidoreductase subunit NqrA